VKHDIRRARFKTAYQPKRWTSTFKGRGFRKRIGGDALYRDRQGRVIDVGRWVELEENRAYRRVAKTNIGNEIMISTVWTGMVHSGRRDVFETMVFGGLLDQEAWRWETERQAQEGHDNVVRLVRLSLAHPEEVEEHEADAWSWGGEDLSPHKIETEKQTP
jgi:hypothetical protein